MKTTRILALVASGLITALLFVAIANGMPVKQPPGAHLTTANQGILGAPFHT